ncbi:hypothetical protein V1514DRAFT_331470 [Lipomyces japonicus]|uniref:uncharacterized protein n=1 Tax=Lipomyces japonicus TaxID=56871 RepID=UPI0034D0011E
MSQTGGTTTPLSTSSATAGITTTTTTNTTAAAAVAAATAFAATNQLPFDPIVECQKLIDLRNKVIAGAIPRFAAAAAAAAPGRSQYHAEYRPEEEHGGRLVPIIQQQQQGVRDDYRHFEDLYYADDLKRKREYDEEDWREREREQEQDRDRDREQRPPLPPPPPPVARSPVYYDGGGGPSRGYSDYVAQQQQQQQVYNPVTASVYASSVDNIHGDSYGRPVEPARYGPPPGFGAGAGADGYVPQLAVQASASMGYSQQVAASQQAQLIGPGVLMEDGYTRDTQRGYELYIPSANKKGRFLTKTGGGGGYVPGAPAGGYNNYAVPAHWPVVQQERA